MTVARHYVMHAKDGHSATLEEALSVLAEKVREVPGSEGVEMLRDIGNEHRFIFIEKWVSVEAHKDASKHLPAEVLAPLGTLLDGPPDGAYFDYLKIV
jgi:quinol monooxygenase YgiN